MCRRPDFLADPPLHLLSARSRLFLHMCAPYVKRFRETGNLLIQRLAFLSDLSGTFRLTHRKNLLHLTERGNDTARRGTQIKFRIHRERAAHVRPLRREQIAQTCNAREMRCVLQIREIEASLYFFPYTEIYKNALVMCNDIRIALLCLIDLVAVRPYKGDRSATVCEQLEFVDIHGGRCAAHYIDNARCACERLREQLLMPLNQRIDARCVDHHHALPQNLRREKHLHVLYCGKLPAVARTALDDLPHLGERNVLRMPVVIVQSRQFLRTIADIGEERRRLHRAPRQQVALQEVVDEIGFTRRILPDKRDEVAPRRTAFPRGVQLRALLLP